MMGLKWTAGVKKQRPDEGRLKGKTKTIIFHHKKNFLYLFIF